MKLFCAYLKIKLDKAFFRLYYLIGSLEDSKISEFKCPSLTKAPVNNTYKGLNVYVCPLKGGY